MDAIQGRIVAGLPFHKLALGQVIGKNADAEADFAAGRQHQSRATAKAEARILQVTRRRKRHDRLTDAQFVGADAGVGGRERGNSDDDGAHHIDRVVRVAILNAPLHIGRAADDEPSRPLQRHFAGGGIKGKHLPLDIVAGHGAETHDVTARHLTGNGIKPLR